MPEKAYDKIEISLYGDCFVSRDGKWGINNYQGLKTKCEYDDIYLRSNKSYDVKKRRAKRSFKFKREISNSYQL